MSVVSEIRRERLSGMEVACLLERSLLFNFWGEDMVGSEISGFSMARDRRFGVIMRGDV